MYWYNPFFIWFYLDLLALLLIILKVDRQLYFEDIVAFVRTAPNLLLKIMAILVVYFYLPLTVPMNIKDLFSKW